jgi:hypothetical protein
MSKKKELGRTIGALVLLGATISLVFVVPKIDPFLKGKKKQIDESKK